MNEYLKVSSLLLIGIVLWAGAQWLARRMAKSDAEWSAKNPPPYPPELSDAGPVPPVSARQKEIAAEHVAKRTPAVDRIDRIHTMLNAKKARYATAAESEGGLL